MTMQVDYAFRVELLRLVREALEAARADNKGVLMQRLMKLEDKLATA